MIFRQSKIYITFATGLSNGQLTLFHEQMETWTIHQANSEYRSLPVVNQRRLGLDRNSLGCYDSKFQQIFDLSNQSAFHLETNNSLFILLDITNQSQVEMVDWQTVVLGSKIWSQSHNLTYLLAQKPVLYHGWYETHSLYHQLGAMKSLGCPRSLCA